MGKYICTICGFTYNETVGYPKGNIAPGTLWDDIPDDWVCPICGVSKGQFKEEHITAKASAENSLNQNSFIINNSDYSIGELSAICSSLSKGCEKQYLFEEAELFNTLASYYKGHMPISDLKNFSSVQLLVQEDLETNYPIANQVASREGDRGSLRSLKWSEQVTRMLSLHLEKVQLQSSIILKESNMYVCEICGFVHIGEECPDICPVCKVPSMKLTQIKREA